MSEEKEPVLERVGPLRLLWGMIVRPRVTLEYLGEYGRRTWWLPALLALLLVVLPVLAAAPHRAQQQREAVAAIQEQQSEQREMTAREQEQMEQAMNIAASPFITTVFPAVAGVAGAVVGWLVWAGALYLGSMALGGRSSFGQMFRMVIWTWLPYALRGLLQIIYILVSGQIIANPGLSGFVVDNRAPVEEMVVAPPSMGQMLLAGLLGRVDLFLFWNLILLVLGVMVATRLPRRKAVVVTLGVWLLLTALSLLPTLIGGFFSQQAMASAGP
jgi:hypothetical protein